MHQILLSYISGTVGLMVFLQFEDYARKFSINWQLHWVYLVLCIFVGIALLGLAVEDNSSSLGGIPREEYIRVVGGILNTEPGKIHEHMHAQASKKLDRGAGGGGDKQRQRYAEKVRRVEVARSEMARSEATSAHNPTPTPIHLRSYTPGRTASSTCRTL